MNVAVLDYLIERSRRAGCTRNNHRCGVSRIYSCRDGWVAVNSVHLTGTGMSNSTQAAILDSKLVDELQSK